MRPGASRTAPTVRRHFPMEHRTRRGFSRYDTQGIKDSYCRWTLSEDDTIHRIGWRLGPVPIDLKGEEHANWRDDWR